MTNNQSFMEVLNSLNKGRTTTELAEGIKKLVAAVKDTGKTGELTFKLKLTPKGKDDGIILVDDEIKLKLPERARPTSLFYSTEENQLSRRDPNQLELKKVVDMDEDEDNEPATRARKAS